MLKKLIAFSISFLLIFEQAGFAQVAPQNFVPGYLQGLLPADHFRPIHLRYFSLDPATDSFELFLDQGDAKNPSESEIQEASRRSVEYFQIGLALPNSAFWVNLRPDSPQDIIDPLLAKTDLGRVLLEADLQLKKDLAMATSPDRPVGKRYWDMMYTEAESLFGSVDEMSIPALSRPWIVPAEVIIAETPSGAYIYKATLKVMLEQDHLKDSVQFSFDDERLKALNDHSAGLIKELILPQLTREVNSSKRYASLRQVYYSLIMAQYFKSKLRGQAAALGAAEGGLISRIDSKDLSGLTSRQPWSPDIYFKAYQKSFQQGEYNKVSEVYTVFGPTIRTYCTGGINVAQVVGNVSIIAQAAHRVHRVTQPMIRIISRLSPEQPVSAQTAMAGSRLYEITKEYWARGSDENRARWQHISYAWLRGLLDLSPLTDSEPAELAWGRGKIAVILYTDTAGDHNGALSDESAQALQNQLMLKGYKVIFRRVSSVDEILPAMEEITAERKASLLIVGGHGTPTSLQLNSKKVDQRYFVSRLPGMEFISAFNYGVVGRVVYELRDVLDGLPGFQEWKRRQTEKQSEITLWSIEQLSGLDAYLEEDAQIILNSCSVAKGSRLPTLARRFAELFPGLDVFGADQISFGQIRIEIGADQLAQRVYYGAYPKKYLDHLTKLPDSLRRRIEAGFGVELIQKQKLLFKESSPDDKNNPEKREMRIPGKGLEETENARLSADEQELIKKQVASTRTTVDVDIEQDGVVVSVKAPVVVSDMGSGAGAFNVELSDGSGHAVPVIVLNGYYDQAIQDEGLFHEVRELYWMARGFSAREAHIIAAAEQVQAFAKDGKSLTPFHQKQLEAMDEESLAAIEKEYGVDGEGRKDQREIRNRAKEVFNDKVAFDKGFVNNYEQQVKKAAKELKRKLRRQKRTQRELERMSRHYVIDGQLYRPVEDKVEDYNFIAKEINDLLDDLAAEDEEERKETLAELAEKMEFALDFIPVNVISEKGDSVVPAITIPAGIDEEANREALNRLSDDELEEIGLGRNRQGKLSGKGFGHMLKHFSKDADETAFRLLKAALNQGRWYYVPASGETAARSSEKYKVFYNLKEFTGEDKFLQINLGIRRGDNQVILIGGFVCSERQIRNEIEAIANNPDAQHLHGAAVHEKIKQFTPGVKISVRDSRTQEKSEHVLKSGIAFFSLLPWEHSGEERIISIENHEQGGIRIRTTREDGDYIIELINGGRGVVESRDGGPSASHPGSSGRMKQSVMSDEDDISDALAARHREFEALDQDGDAFLLQGMLKGEFIKWGFEARIVMADLGPDIGAYHFIASNGSNVIVVNSRFSWESNSDNAWHEARKMFWMNRGFTRHEADIISSAEFIGVLGIKRFATRFLMPDPMGREGYDGVGSLPRFIQEQIDSLSQQEALILLKEERTQHHDLLLRAKEKFGANINMALVPEYENQLRLHLLKRVILGAPEEVKEIWDTNPEVRALAKECSLEGVFSNRMQNKVAVVVYPYSDHNGALRGNYARVSELEALGFRVHFKRVASVDKMVDYLRETTATRKADLVIIAGHGNELTLQLGETLPPGLLNNAEWLNWHVSSDQPLLTVENADKLSEVLVGMTGDAQLIFESCSVGGKYANGLASRVSQVLSGHEIFASPEALLGKQKLEYELDPEGRILQLKGYQRLPVPLVRRFRLGLDMPDVESKVFYKEEHFRKFVDDASPGDPNIAAAPGEAVPHSVANQAVKDGLPFDLRLDRKNIVNYENADGIPVVPIKGLHKKTGQYGHIGLGQQYGRPVIYIDADYMDNEAVHKHEMDEIEQWEGKREELGLLPEEMRGWIRENIEEAKVFAEKAHKAAQSLDGIGGHDGIEEIEDEIPGDQTNGFLNRLGGKVLSTADRLMSGGNDLLKAGNSMNTAREEYDGLENFAGVVVLDANQKIVAYSMKDASLALQQNQRGFYVNREVSAGQLNPYRYESMSYELEAYDRQEVETVGPYSVMLLLDRDVNIGAHEGFNRAAAGVHEQINTFAARFAGQRNLLNALRSDPEVEKWFDSAQAKEIFYQLVGKIDDLTDAELSAMSIDRSNPAVLATLLQRLYTVAMKSDSFMLTPEFISSMKPKQIIGEVRNIVSYALTDWLFGSLSLCGEQWEKEITDKKTAKHLKRNNLADVSRRLRHELHKALKGEKSMKQFSENRLLRRILKTIVQAWDIDIYSMELEVIRGECERLQWDGQQAFRGFAEQLDTEQLRKDVLLDFLGLLVLELQVAERVREVHGADITGFLGRGADGLVFKAVWRGRTIALKIDLPRADRSLDTLRNDLQELQEVLSRHPHDAFAQIIALDSFPVAGGDLVLEMNEFIDGMSLKDHLTAPGRSNMVQTLDLLAQFLEIHRYLYDRGFINRDSMNLENVIITKQGKAYWIDFGNIVNIKRDLSGASDAESAQRLRFAKEQLVKSTFKIITGQHVGVDAEAMDFLSIGIALFKKRYGEDGVRLWSKISPVLEKHLRDNSGDIGNFIEDMTSVLSTYDPNIAAARGEAVPHRVANQAVKDGLPFDLRLDRKNIVNYENERGIPVVPVKGLYDQTGQYGHIGLGQQYGRPVIYIDADYMDDEAVLKHEMDEVEQWEGKRVELGLQPEEMRGWIRGNIEEAKEFAERAHQASQPLDEVAGRDGVEEIEAESPGGFLSRLMSGRNDLPKANALMNAAREEYAGLESFAGVVVLDANQKIVAYSMKDASLALQQNQRGFYVNREVSAGQLNPYRHESMAYELEAYDRQELETVGPYSVTLLSAPDVNISAKGTRQAPEKKGGIDFRALPFVVQPQAVLSGSAAAIAALRQLAQQSQVKDLDKEWQEIQKLCCGQQVPYARIKEYMAVCDSRGNSQDRLSAVSDALAQILRAEEDCAVTTSSQLTELLVLLNSLETA